MVNTINYIVFSELLHKVTCNEICKANDSRSNCHNSMKINTSHLPREVSEQIEVIREKNKIETESANGKTVTIIFQHSHLPSYAPK